MPPEVQEGATETSSVRDDLLAAMKEYEEPIESAPERPRDEAGRFASGDKHDPEHARPADSGESRLQRPAAESARPTDSGAADPSGNVPAGTRVAPASAPPELAAAPPAWSNATKAEWTKLPEAVRTEILKREADVHKGFTKMDEERSFAKEMQKAVAPYEAIIRADGGTIPGAVASVLNTAYILRTGDPQTKARAIAQVCQQYGIDLNLLAQPPSQNPHVDALQQKIDRLESQWTQRQQAERQQVEQQVLTAVETFGQDPKHPHFKTVSAHMGALMQAGEAKDMDQAYEMAVWARPDLRAQLLAEQTAQQTAAQQTRQRADKARAKAVSVRGGPGGYTPPATNPNASVRESLMAAVDEVNSRL